MLVASCSMSLVPIKQNWERAVPHIADPRPALTMLIMLHAADSPLQHTTAIHTYCMFTDVFIVVQVRSVEGLPDRPLPHGGADKAS